jgi:transposase InsO family protein
MGSIWFPDMYIALQMKNKTDVEKLKAFKKIYKQSKIRANRSDNESEFINKNFVSYLEKNYITQILSLAGKSQPN